MNRLVNKLPALALLVLMVLATSAYSAETPKNIIYLIGDGMGIGHISAARLGGPGRDGKLAIDTMPFTGLVMTHPLTGNVTDSGAAGTALATGVKTNNGAVSMTPDGKKLRSILLASREKGKSSGIISTKFITDATPAVFVANVPKRSQRTDIAEQMINSGVDVILGGGRQYFLPKDSGGMREDGKNLLEEAKKMGFAVADSAETMTASNSKRLIGLFAPDNLTSQRPEPTIAEMTSKAISVLSKNPKGFFLMSEGAKIDSEAHKNNTLGVVKETLMFDEAVKIALDFAQKDKNTLVVVTADHDTGGMAVLNANDQNPKFSAGWVSGEHTGNMVPVYAFGPGAQLFIGTHDNTDIPKIMARLIGAKLN